MTYTSHYATQNSLHITELGTLGMMVWVVAGPLPYGQGAVLSLHPPRPRCVHSLPVDLQPAAQAPQPLLKHRRDRPLRRGAHIQQVVTPKGHGVNQVLVRT